MLTIQQVTSSPLQQQSVILPDGSTLTYTLAFVPLQYGWFFRSLTWGSWQQGSLRVVNSPNLLYQWRNLLPFGLACYSTANREPTQQQDFSSGASVLYILTAAEVAAYTAFLQAGPNGVA